MGRTVYLPMMMRFTLLKINEKIEVNIHITYHTWILSNLEKVSVLICSNEIFEIINVDVQTFAFPED